MFLGAVCIIGLQVERALSTVAGSAAGVARRKLPDDVPTLDQFVARSNLVRTLMVPTLLGASVLR